jgi:hypothetical protein
MARYPRPHRLLFRRTAVLIALIMAGGGLVALEHTATGASTGTPSSSYGHTSSNQHGDNGKNDDGKNGKNGDKHHHPTTSTSSTTMPPKHCRDMSNDGKDNSGKDNKGKDKHHDDKHHCRPPSGGQTPKPPKPPKYPYDKHSTKNGHR